MRLAAEGLLLLGHQVAAVAHEVLRIDGLLMRIRVQVRVAVLVEWVGSEEGLGGLMRGLLVIAFPVEEEGLMEAILALLRM